MFIECVNSMQIWIHADQNRTGFLSRPEFYNALKLVTVAQSKRELTPDIVKAALYGPASAKIPAPQINVAATPVPSATSAAASPIPQMGATAQPPPQNFGLRGPSPSVTSVNQQFGMVSSTAGMNQQFRPVPSSTGMNQQFGSVPSSSGINHQFAQVQPASTMNQQFPRSASTMNQQFPQPASTLNQQFGQVQPGSTMSQQFGVRPMSTIMNQQYGQLQPSNTNMNQQTFPSQGNQMRPPLSTPTVTTSRPPQSATTLNNTGAMMGPGLPNQNDDWLGGRNVAASTGPITQVLNRGSSPSISSGASNAQDPFSAFSAATVTRSGNGSTTGDVFSAIQSSSQKGSSAPQQPTSSLPTSSAIVPLTSSPQPSAKPDPFEVLQSTRMTPSTGSQVAKTHSLPKSNQQTPAQTTSAVLSSGVQIGVGSSTPEQSQVSWPKMTRPGIQKYAKVFMEVDTDRDGKITGDQARNLFLSWRLPRGTKCFTHL